MKHLTAKLFLVPLSLALQLVSYAQVDTVSAERKAEVQRRIDSINKAIKEKGYTWKAGLTSMSYHSPEEIRQLCGVLVDSSSSQLQSLKTDGLNPLSKVEQETRFQSVDTRWGSWVSHITNQASCGDCWAHAATGVADALLNHYYGSNVDIGIDPDTLAAHAVGGNQMCSGAELNTGMAYLANHRSKGFLLSASFFIPPGPNTYYKISSYDYQSASGASIKNALQSSPVLVAMDAWCLFEHYSEGVYQPLPDDGDYPIIDPLTGQIIQHAVVILGFDDVNSCWICRNSWGRGWGEEFNGGGGAQNERGYFRIKYGVCHIDNRTMVTGSVTSNTCFAKLIPNFQTFQAATNSSFADEECAYVLGSASAASNGTIPVGSRVQVKSGATLTVAPGVSLSFGSGSSLTVNGTLNATSATFDWTGSSNWGGIIFNSGSSGSLSHCNISHGSPGVKCNGVLPSITNCTFNVNSMGLWLNNVGTPSAHISGNNFFNQSGSGQGIVCFFSSPYIDGGTYFYNNAMGVFCVGSSPRISSCPFTNNGIGVYCTNSSSPIIGGYNRMAGNSAAVCAEGPCYITSSQSDVYQYNGAKAIRANNSAIVVASNNYWGQHPPNPADFVATNGSTISWQPGAASPWTSSLPKMSAQANTARSTSPAGGSPDVSLDQRCFEAAKLLADGKHAEAREIYVQELRAADNDITKRYVLMQLAECYRAAGRRDFTDFLSTEVRPNLSVDGDLYATTLQLENLFLVPDHNYPKLLENLAALKDRFSKNESTLKNALFDLGYIHTELLADAAQGKGYYDELRTKYPDDMLTWQAKLLLGEIDGIPSSAIAWKEGAAEAQSPATVALLSNYPNPFNPTTIINYQVPQEGIVTLKVFDVLGREVTTLVNEQKAAGYYSASFGGAGLSSGMYLVRLTLRSAATTLFVQTMKMLLAK